MIRRLAAVSLALALAGPARGADGPTRRFAVVAGASAGGAGRTALRYATTDARDVARVLRRLGGVGLGDLVLVEEPDADRLRRALAGVAAEAARAHGAGRRVELFVYYSGHSDEEGLLLGETRLSYADLRHELDGIPADVRVAILDSCASGAITRAKGGVHRPPFLLDEASRVTGHAFLTSSAAHEAAQESDRLRASFFTHALLTGLRGAADASGDGVVTLNEAYQFAFRETLAGTEASQAGPQHATYDIGLVGSGDVVMTDLRRADGILVVPDAVDGRVFVRNGTGALVAELRKVRGARLELALEEGRYDVRVVRDQKALGATVTLGASERLVLDETRLRPVGLEAATARGPNGPTLAAAIPAAVAGSPAPAPAPAAAPEDGFRLAPGYQVAARAGLAVSRRPGSPTGEEVQLAATAWGAGIVGLELATGYGRSSGTTEGRLPSGQFFMSGSVHDVVTVVPTTVTLKLGLPSARIHPYALGGVGAYFTKIERRPAREYAWLWQGPRTLSDDGVFVLFHVGAGADVAVTRSIRAVLEVGYRLGRARLLEEDVLMDSFHVTAGLALAF